MKPINMNKLLFILALLCPFSYAISQKAEKISSRYFLKLELFSFGPEFLTGNPSNTLLTGMHFNMFNTYISSYRNPHFNMGIEYSIDAFHKFDPTPAEQNIMDRYEIVSGITSVENIEDLEEIRTSRSSFGISLGYQSQGNDKKLAYFGSVIPTYYKFDNGLDPPYHKEDKGYGIIFKFGIDYPIIENMIAIRISYSHGLLPAYKLPLLPGMRTIEGPGSFGTIQFGFLLNTYDPDRQR